MDNFGNTDETHDITITVDARDISSDMRMPTSSDYRGMSDRDHDLKLVIVFQKDTNIPLYFRYVPKNLLQIPSLTAVNRRFLSLGIGANFTMMDSKCCSTDNISKMLENNIPFTMMIPEDDEYYSYVRNKVRNNEAGARTMYVRDNIEFTLYAGEKTLDNGCTCHVYAVDVPEHVRYEMEPDMRVIMTSDRMEPEEAVSVCYVRHIADGLRFSTESYVNRNAKAVGKSPTSIRGHMIVSFIAASVIQMLRNDMDALGIDAMDAYDLMKNQKCKVFKSRVIPTVPKNDLENIYNTFNMECPTVIPRLRED